MLLLNMWTRSKTRLWLWKVSYLLGIIYYKPTHNVYCLLWSFRTFNLCVCFLFLNLNLNGIRLQECHLGTWKAYPHKLIITIKKNKFENFSLTLQSKHDQSKNIGVYNCVLDCLINDRCTIEKMQCGIAIRVIELVMLFP